MRPFIYLPLTLIATHVHKYQLRYMYVGLNVYKYDFTCGTCGASFFASSTVCVVQSFSFALLNIVRNVSAFLNNCSHRN